MIHVIPENDDKKHIESEFCECLPMLHPDGFYVHNAWDFREVKEVLGEEKV